MYLPSTELNELGELTELTELTESSAPLPVKPALVETTNLYFSVGPCVRARACPLNALPARQLMRACMRACRPTRSSTSINLHMHLLASPRQRRLSEASSTCA